MQFHMKTRYLILLTVLSMVNVQVFAQKAKADRLFAQYAFAKAIPYYEELAAKNDAAAAYAMERLGDCYRLTSQFEAAADWYGKAIKSGATGNDLFFNSGQVLRSLGRYDDAAVQFRHYAGLNGADPRGALFAKYCEEIKNWPAPENAYTLTNAEAINSPYADFSPVYTRDGFVFTSDRMSRSDSKHYGWTGAYYLNLFFISADSSKAGQISFSGSPSLFSARINENYHDGPACFTKDFKTIYFTRVVRKNGDLDSSRYYTNKLRIFSATYDGVNWSNPEPFFLNSDTYSVGHPAVSPDGSTLYFVSDMPGGYGGTDLYCVHRLNSGWSAPENLGPDLNTFGNEMFPFLLNDSVLYFSSDALPGLGSLDVFKSEKTGTQWRKPENLKAPLNSPADDFGILISPDGESGMLSSNRPGGKGEDDIYLLSIRERLPDSVLITGLVKDRESMEPLPNCTVFALNEDAGVVVVLKTDDSGRYRMRAKQGTSFVLKGMKNSYSPDCLKVDLPEKEITSTVENRDLVLGRYQLNQIFKLENIYYDFDKWDIRSDAADELYKVVEFLNDNPGITVELGSHTDSRGTFKYNEKLSDKRARSAVAYITSHGVSPERISARGYGESQLVNRCSDGVTCSDQEHQQNRRTEIKITGIVQPEAANRQEPLDVYRQGQQLDLKTLKPDFFKPCAEPDTPGSL